MKGKAEYEKKIKLRKKKSNMNSNVNFWTDFLHATQPYKVRMTHTQETSDMK